MSRRDKEACPACGGLFYESEHGNSNPDAPDFGPANGNCDLCGFGWTQGGGPFKSVADHAAEYIKERFPRILFGLSRIISRNEEACEEMGVRDFDAIPGVIKAARRLAEDWKNGRTSTHNMDALAKQLKKMTTDPWEQENQHDEPPF